jgi:flagellar assembly protein FliH
MIIKKRTEKFNEEKINKEPLVENKTKEDNIKLFDLDNIDFSQRQERRRGNRRRGYRRIDDRNLISRAQEEAGSIRDAAAQEGFKAGLEKAQSDIEQIKNALISFINAKQEVFEYIAPDILEISIDIARKIVKKEIEQNPQIVLETITDVLKTISNEETKISIRVNPTQLALAKENLPEIISSSGLEVRTNVVSDDTIKVGGCIIQSSNGIVDATVDTQLEIIKEAFKGM